MPDLSSYVVLGVAFIVLAAVVAITIVKIGPIVQVDMPGPEWFGLGYRPEDEAAEGFAKLPGRSMHLGGVELCGTQVREWRGHRIEWFFALAQTFTCRLAAPAQRAFELRIDKGGAFHASDPELLSALQADVTAGPSLRHLRWTNRIEVKDDAVILHDTPLLVSKLHGLPTMRRDWRSKRVSFGWPDSRDPTVKELASIHHDLAELLVGIAKLVA